MSRFEFHATKLKDLFVVNRKTIEDDRGYLSRFWCADEFARAGWVHPIVQMNHTLTRQCGTLRGMHFQYSPHAEMKLVTCLRGEVFDVAVDLRVGSATRLEWHGETLTEWNRRSLLIPEGFAHGFQALTDDVELLYCHTHRYVPEAEGGVLPLDPVLSISWPVAVTNISLKDQSYMPLTDNPEFGVNS